MSGYIGNYEHNLDSKNRMFMPVKLRDQLGDSFIIRVKPDEFPRIECFTEEAFDKKIEAELNGVTDEEERDEILFLTHANASEVSVDSQGRICIPSKILKCSEVKKECLIIGRSDCVQIWNPEIYDTYYEQVRADKIAEREAKRAEAKKRRELMADGRFLEPKNNG